MNPLYVLQPKAVSPSNANDKDAILAELARVLAETYDLEGADILESLEERERLGSTGFGGGVALPHARIADLHRPVAALLRLENPAEFDAADGLPVELVFGLLSPENAGATHLHALAAISRLMRDEKTKEELLEAPDADAMFGLLTNVTDRDVA